MVVSWRFRGWFSHQAHLLDDLGEAKVGDLDEALVVDEEVLGLEVAVDDVLVLHVLKG